MKEHTFHSSLALRSSCRRGSGPAPTMPLFSLSWCPPASALQWKADTSAVITVEAVITSVFTVFSLYHYILTVQTWEEGLTTVTPHRRIKRSPFSTNDFNHCPHTAVTGSRQNQDLQSGWLFRKPGLIPQVTPDAPCTFWLSPSLPDPSC